MTDLTVTLCGIELKNPLILASGPLSWNADAIRAAFAAGAAAVVTKTIRPEATINPVPHIAAAGRGSLLNTEGWSDLPAQQWIERELPALADRDGVLIASTGHTPAEVSQLAGPLAESGVDMLELVSYQAKDAGPMVAAAKQAVTIPVLIKVSGNWPNLVSVVGACLEAGADGVTAIDSIGPALRIDVKTGQPLLGSFAWLSGQTIRPIALRAVAEIRLHQNIPVVGTGGVGRAEDVVEMIMAGAAAVGVHTAPLLRGVDWFGETLTRLEQWLDKHNHTCLSDLRGLALPHLRKSTSHTLLAFAFDAETCIQCERCVTVCAYRARRLTPQGEMLLDQYLCHWCGLCATICPTEALRIQRE
ncbi:MAG: 4Fe-4S dicluster domain-containing protein [Chloroflexota bacterium]|nr:4Fe-4S dicluster domain-containing protein [Chloroflexota bacterium]